MPNPTPQMQRMSRVFAAQTPDLKALEASLREAADTLQRLPRSAMDGPAGARSAWPEMIRASRFAVSGTRRVPQARPSPAAIQRLDEMVLLLWQVTPRQRQLLWARACGVRWMVLCEQYRRSRTTLNRDYRRALLALAEAAAGTTGKPAPLARKRLPAVE